MTGGGGEKDRRGPLKGDKRFTGGGQRRQNGASTPVAGGLADGERRVVTRCWHCRTRSMTCISNG
jgi:hypothetical protein